MLGQFSRSAPRAPIRAPVAAIVRALRSRYLGRVEATRRSAASLTLMLALCCAGAALWLLHAHAWDLGRRSPVLNYDSAQYALAARELAEHGRFATPFALPLELQRYARPPWPLAVVQPGLVLLEGAVFKLAPAPPMARADALTQSRRESPNAWLVLIVPFCCFLMIGVVLGTAASLLAAGAGPVMARVAGATVGLAFLLDPEAQHLATGGFTEMPFTLGLLVGVMLLVRGVGARAGRSCSA